MSSEVHRDTSFLFATASGATFPACLWAFRAAGRRIRPLGTVSQY
jgi:hypothetical protein